MTVVLCGIGADTTNCGRVAPIYEDGSFEYIPIPEKHRDTAETATYGTWELRYADGVAADLLTSIIPQPTDGTRIRAADLRRWPLHYDPNLDALTYGEHRPGYVTKLQTLDSGDIVGFYAGLRGPDKAQAHRYLIGYFTVETVETIPPEASRADARAVFERHPENAHAKRARDRRRHYDDETVVIVQGKEPGGVFDRVPLRLSKYYIADGNERPQYYLDTGVSEEFQIVDGRANMQFKPAYRCDLDAETFIDRVGIPGAQEVDATRSPRP